ncbi:hypothetical protein T03_8779 [Trichinella britovi]|uniref:Uncharacterized protein n=1 Tax=Trichinella britovi TaxID=45882 RepID=A0A0V1CQ72_TRIBR|nr:hypothetical protein T03_8779 [Trichinella britovi]
MVEGQSISLLSAQEVFSTLSMFMQRHSMLSRIIWFAVGNSGDSSMFLELSLATHGLYFQLLLLFVMLLCCYPCEHDSLPEQNAKRELAIPDVATTCSLLRKQKSFDHKSYQKMRSALISVKVTKHHPISMKYLMYKKNHDSLSGWVQKLLLLVRVTSSISVGD